MRLRLSILYLAAAALFIPSLVGCSAMTPGRMDAVQPVTDAPRAGNAYLLRGFIGVFSTGMDRLGNEVNAVGVHGEVFQDDQWSDLADQIAVRFHGHPDAEPIVLIGHSYGADDIIRIARKLDAVNVPVTLLITLDPVTPPAVPKNVRLCVNLYESNGLWDKLPWLRGVPLAQEPGSRGALYNADVRTERTDLLEPGLDHFNIEKKQKIHDEILRLLLAVCPTRHDWSASRSGQLPAVATAVKVRALPTGTTRAPASSLVAASMSRETSN